MSIRIAIITLGFSKDEKDYGGAAAFHNFVKELSLHDEIDISVFSFYYPLNQQEYRFYGVKVFSFASFKTDSKKNSVINKLRIWRKCEKKFIEEHKLKKFDLVHSMWARESGFTASRLSRKLKIPLIANIGGGELADLKEIDYGSRTKHLQKYFVDITFSRADIIITGSDYISDKINMHYGNIISSKVRKLPFGTDENIFFIKEPGIEQLPGKELPALIIIANVVPVKSHETLFKALKIVSEKFPFVILECYGRDDRKILKNLAEKYCVSGNVKLKGFIEYENLPEILNKQSIFVLSSLYESQNMAMIEAAFCGVPVVSTNAGAAKEITEHIIEPGNYESLAEKIIYIIENYPGEKQKALSKRDLLASKYSLKNTTQNFINLYKSLLINL